MEVVSIIDDDDIVAVTTGKRKHEPLSGREIARQNMFLLFRDKKSADIEKILASIPGDDEDYIMSRATEELMSLPSEDVDNIDKILQMFPDADIDGVKKKLGELHALDAVVNDMMEHSYKKRQRVSSSSSSSYPPSYFQKTDRITSDLYRQSAFNALCTDFPAVSVKSLRVVFARNKMTYYPTWKVVTDCLSGSSSSSELITKKAPKKSVKNTIDLVDNDAEFIAEYSWLHQFMNEEQEKKDLELAQKINQEEAAEVGCTFECECCYNTDLPFESMVQCSEGHVVCSACLRKFAETTIFGSSIKGKSGVLTCLSCNEKCTGSYADHQLIRALDGRTYAKYQEILTSEIISRAIQSGLVRCHRCNLALEVDEDVRVMVCPRCEAQTCSECGEEAHVPLRCEEVEKKTHTDKRLKIEEAMTLARVRECPSCKSRFYKTEGCNKMTCGCGINICYQCRANISVEKYNHFCQTPHCDHSACNKCLLFTDTVYDDRMAMKQAGLVALDDVDDDGVKVDIKGLLEGGDIKEKKTTVGMAVAAPVHVGRAFALVRPRVRRRRRR